MAAFLHHCPFFKSVPKAALRRTGATLLSLADRCPIIARQISVTSTASLDDNLSLSPARLKTNQLPAVDQRRLFAQTAPQVERSTSKGCPFVSSHIGMVQASPEVQEDIQEGKLCFTEATSAQSKGKREIHSKAFYSERVNPPPFSRFDDFTPEGFKGFHPPKISSNQHCHPPPQRQYGYV